MSTLAKWNPFRDLEDIQNRLSPWFGRIALRGSGDETMTTSAWAPLVDITEDDKEYLIKVELPELGSAVLAPNIESDIARARETCLIAADGCPASDHESNDNAGACGYHRWSSIRPVNRQL
jgi:hypothetical protein